MAERYMTGSAPALKRDDFDMVCEHAYPEIFHYASTGIVQDPRPRGHQEV